MTFEQLWAILRARWIIAFSAFLVIFGSVAAYTWLVPKSYTAVASVLVDVKSPDPISGGVPAGVMAPSYLMTQIDVITSARVAQRVVTNLKLTEVPTLRERWIETTKGTGSFEGYLAQLFRSGLDARPSRGSNVINLRYESADPQFAATVVNAFVQAYLEVSMDLRTDPAKQYGTFFDLNAKQQRERLEAAQGKLSAFQQRQGLTVTDERMDVEMARLNNLAAQLVSMETASADSGSRKNMVSSQQGGNTQEVMNSPLVASLKSEIVRAEATLGQLATRLGEQHPQVIELKANLDQLRSKLDIEVKRVSNSFALSNTMNQSREAQVKESVEAQRARVLKMKQVRDEAAMLQRDVENAQRTYEGVVSRLNMTVLESQAVLNNVVALEYATAPSIPSSPRVFVNIALGALVGGVLALVLVLVVERADRRLRTTSEIEGLLHLPYMGSVPNFSKQIKGGGTSSKGLLTGHSNLKALSAN
jgi:succinoglycan biosynthesis transport protein ExoP